MAIHWNRQQPSKVEPENLDKLYFVKSLNLNVQVKTSIFRHVQREILYLHERPEN